MAIEWEKARRIQEFLDAYEAAVPEERRTDVSRRWLEAARRYASQLNPLSAPEAIARDLEPADEVVVQAIAELKGRGSTGPG
jgi:hypothetical protein